MFAQRLAGIDLMTRDPYVHFAGSFVCAAPLKTPPNPASTGR
jgi:hypothetical protein